MSKKLLLICGVAVLFVACDSAKSLEYYKEHLDEAKARADECNKLIDKGKKLSESQTQDCINADLAVFTQDGKNPYENSNFNEVAKNLFK